MSRVARTLIVVLIASLPTAAAGCKKTNTCSSGLDVRNLDDAGVSESLKLDIRDPGPIIATGDNRYPSGKIVIIRAAAADWPVNSAVSAAYLEPIFFGSDPNIKSLRRYFESNSYGQFSPSKGAVPPWLTLAKTLGSYLPGVEANAAYMQDVLKLADVAWDGLDGNDGAVSRAEVQIVVLIPNAMPSTGFASVRSVAIGSVQTPHGTFNFGTRPILYYSVKANADPQAAVNPIRNLPGVAHELLHAFFNLPDRYGPNTGTGNYDLMSTSYTWMLLTMPDRMTIGWITPKVQQGHGGQCLQFVASSLQAGALVLVPPPAMLSPSGVLEYWAVENRNKKYSDGGYDDALPDAGLAVWYVAKGTYSQGYDDVRLLDFSKIDQDPDLYSSPGNSAFFKVNPANHKRLLLNRQGQWSLLWFQNVSDPANGSSGLFMFGEF